MRKARTGPVLLLLLVTSGTLATACGPTMIPGTEIEDTEANHAIYDLVQRYRKSVEERDVTDLRQLVSREYFDNAGTTDEAKDDYGYEQLTGGVIPLLKDNIKKVHYDLRLTEIGVGEKKAYATFEYFARFLYTEGGKDSWFAVNDFNKLELVREDGQWKIAAGL